MGPNDADIVRVSVREAGSPVTSQTLDPAQNAEVVVEVEAGSAIFTAGAQYQIGLAVQDLVNGQAIPFNPVPNKGTLSVAPWNVQATELESPLFLVLP